MKKLFIILALFLTVNVFGQSYPTGTDLPISKVYVDSIIVGLTPIRCPNHLKAQWATFTTEDPTAKFWILGDTTYSSIGYGNFSYNDTHPRWAVMNTNVFYLVSDEADTKVIMLWGE